MSKIENVGIEMSEKCRVYEWMVKGRLGCGGRQFTAVVETLNDDDGELAKRATRQKLGQNGSMVRVDDRYLVRVRDEKDTLIEQRPHFMTLQQIEEIEKRAR